MSKELKNVEKQIAHLEEQTKSKRHGKDSNELKVLSKLSDLYKRRNQLKSDLDLDTLRTNQGVFHAVDKTREDIGN